MSYPQFEEKNFDPSFSLGRYESIELKFEYVVEIFLKLFVHKIGKDRIRSNYLYCLAINKRMILLRMKIGRCKENCFSFVLTLHHLHVVSFFVIALASMTRELRGEEDGVDLFLR